MAWWRSGLFACLVNGGVTGGVVGFDGVGGLSAAPCPGAPAAAQVPSGSNPLDRRRRHGRAGVISALLGDLCHALQDG